ncbi:hypothetical protein IE53DRAFT_390051 [Violaceomyces palustris]|uniref:Uncharacterized protein n=1 Tax=Violaceomyces palustris TaxID=1673888 RepID=A0ACD0NPV9_9BASI|nr:hypothetical protein IE53DRAFT_390051 [Violaceomyces palustris]
MVCKKCEKTLSKASAPDPFRNRNAAGFLVASGSGASKVGAAAPKMTASGLGAATGSSGRPVGQNKLLSKANRFNPTASKCKVCKQNVSMDRATYCQGCAYKRGICAICGKQILDVKMYKQSST